jgi:hypothetical protein
MPSLPKVASFTMLLSMVNASMLVQKTTPENSFEVGFDSVRRQLSEGTTLGDGDDPVRRQATPQSAGAHGDGFIHRGRTVGAEGAVSMLELGTDEESFKAHMKDLVAHGMHRRILGYSRHQGWACDTAGNVIDANMTMVKCKTLCNSDLSCTCYQFNKQSQSCSLQKAASCTIKKCMRSGSNDVYIQKAIWARDPLRLVRHQGMDCRDGKGAVQLDEPEEAALQKLSLSKCKERCGSMEECTCFKWDRTSGQCSRMKECRSRQCAKSGSVDTYLHEAIHNGYDQKYGGTDW